MATLKAIYEPRTFGRTSTSGGEGTGREAPSPACGERVGVRGLGDWPRPLTLPLILTFSP